MRRVAQLGQFYGSVPVAQLSVLSSVLGAGLRVTRISNDHAVILKCQRGTSQKYVDF